AEERTEFTSLLEGWSPLSYLMPAYFQYWGQLDTLNATAGPNNTPYPTARASPSWEGRGEHFRSKLSEVGPPARKIAAADGTRYLDGPPSYQLDHDVSPLPSLFGSF